MNISKKIYSIFFPVALFMISFSCGEPYKNFTFSDVNFKIVHVNNPSFRQQYGYPGDSNCCIALMQFNITYMNGNPGIFGSGKESGLDGISSKITSCNIYDAKNQEISSSIKGFNFAERDFNLDTIPGKNYETGVILFLLSYKDLNDFVSSVNMNKPYSSGFNVSYPIILTVPEILTESAFTFKIHFENGDSLVKRFNLSNTPIKNVQVY